MTVATPFTMANTTLTYMGAPLGNTSNLTVPQDDRPPRIPVSNWPEYHLAMDIVYWGFPIVIFAGSLGNVLAMAVLLTKRMRYTSVNVYLAYLALMDTMVLYMSGFKTWLRLMTGFELLHVSDVGCRTIMFLILMSLHVSAWLVVAVSLDRFVAVWFPFTAMRLCTPTRARILCALITVVLSAYNSYAFWLVKLSTRGGRHTCSGGPDSYFMHLVQPWMKLSTYSCIPFVVVLILNICIIIKVVPGFKAKGRRGSSECDSRASCRNVKDTRLTAMLIWVSVSWLILTAPIMLWTFVAKPTSDSHESAKRTLAKTVAFLLMYTNHGLNFYLYCLSGKRFRKALVVMMCCRKDKPKAQSETSMKIFRSTVRRHDGSLHQQMTHT